LHLTSEIITQEYVSPNKQSEDWIFKPGSYQWHTRVETFAL
jgi:hypothetical protein